MGNDTGNSQSLGDGSEGFSRCLPDDCVEYTISIIDSTLKDQYRREKLRKVQSSAISLTKGLLGDYIWQRDNFHLDLLQENGSSILRGKTAYGDSVEDEWLIVYILRELSNIHPDIWIRVVDTDGQFLLIEAANTLPKWLNPEVADFRVWIHCGRLLIIPLDSDNGQKSNGNPKSRKLTLEVAYTFIRRYRSKMFHSPLIEAEAFYRLEKYPEQIKNSLHHSLTTIPRKLAYIIRQNASYISPAVEAFYLRDPIALRPLQTSSGGKLVFPPNDLVTVSVKFTKVGYAQLKSQQFAAPPVWSQHLNRDEARMGIEVGMKLTSGFEMLVSDHQNQDKRQVREIKLLLEDLETRQDGLPTDQDVQIWPKIQDDESWLDISFESLERELAGRREKPVPGCIDGFGDKGAQENLRKMVARFEDFLNDDTAGADGAEFLEDMDNDNDDEDTSGDDAESEDVSFDEGQFATTMKEMMGMSASETKTPSMPAWKKQDGVAEGLPSTVERSNSNTKDKLAGSSMEPRPGQPATEPNFDPSSESEEEAEIRQTMEGMEHELRSAGALRLNQEAFSEIKQQNKIIDDRAQRPEHESIAEIADDRGFLNEEIDIDLNLAKNMLESFKGQAGMAGPGGNLVAMMGCQLPRDEDADASTRGHKSMITDEGIRCRSTG